MSIEVEFVGGYLDGQLRVVPATEGGVPEQPVLVAVQPILPSRTGDAAIDDGAVEVGVRKAYYDLELSARDDGPLYLYRLRVPGRL